MNKFITVLILVSLGGLLALCVAQQESLSPDLKAVALKDAACTAPGGAQNAEAKAVDGQNVDVNSDSTVETLAIRTSGREVGTIVEVQGACHCQNGNCDALVYLRNGEGYRLALHEKYASLHPMKIVKQGMPSLTGQFEVSTLKMETTVYDWDGKSYKPSLCATVIKGKRVPSITRHPCKPPAQ
ncbi:MAG TPA: hypothetical protein VH024_01180 [Candidatus Angelobacter sp.]|jgi:hypothetical protein|nr:hypothetical protein [Candidatus Angelobacter sp.]